MTIWRTIPAVAFILLALFAPLPVGAAARVPWTTSKVQGSPEPPPAYTTERVYPAVRFQDPVALYFEPLTNWVFVVEHMAKLRVFPNRPAADRATLAADFTAITGPGGESYSIAFHPGFATNRLVFAALLTREPKRSMGVWRMTMKLPASPEEPPRLETDGAVRLLEWWSDVHNGCDLHFGPDGFLYISAGDGAPPAPPDIHRTGQSLDDLMSSILRIDVDRPAGGKAYSIPKDNPFVNRPGARPEVWALPPAGRSTSMRRMEDIRSSSDWPVRWMSGGAGGEPSPAEM